jgi:hypothetical protein
MALMVDAAAAARKRGSCAAALTHESAESDPFAVAPRCDR